MTSISSLGSAVQAQQKRMFAKLDLDSSGTIDRNEFTSGAPKGVSADQAGSLFDSLSGGATAITAEDLATAFQQMSGDMRNALISAQGGGRDGRLSAEDLFAKLDADGDGAVSREEFVSGRPDDVSEEMADKLFSKIAGDGTDSITQQEFAAGMQQPPPPPGGPGGPGGGQSAEEVFSALDADGDGVVSREEFLAGRPDNVTEDQASELFASITGDADSITLDEFKEGMPPPPTEQAAQTDQQDELFKKLLAMLNDGQSDDAASGSGKSSLDQFMAAIAAYASTAQSNAASQKLQSTLTSALSV